MQQLSTLLFYLWVWKTVYSLHFCRHFSIFRDKQPLLETVQVHTCPPGGETWGEFWCNIQGFLGFSSWKENSNVPWCTVITFSESRGLYKLSWRSIASRLDGGASKLCSFTYPTFPVSPGCSPVLCVNSSAVVSAFGHQTPSRRYILGVSSQGILE